MTLKPFKIRCSQIGRIMTNPRSKKAQEAGELSETTKSYVKEWLTKEIYNFDKPIETKEIQKGIEVESEAIDLYGLYKDAFFVKNEDSFKDDHMTGTPDIITDTHVIDIKCPWDCYTFPAFETQLPTSLYYWQLQGYMSLTGLEKARIVYALMNTPLELRYSELDHADYTELDLKLRFKEFDVIRDNEKIDLIYERVEQIRNYLKNEIEPIHTI